MNRVPLIILAVLVLGSAGFGLSQLNKVRKLTESASAWDSEKAALQKRIWDLQRQIGDVERSRSTGPNTRTAGTEGNKPDDGRPVAEANRAIARNRFREEGGRFAAIMNNPDLQKLMAVERKGALDSHYSSLFKQLQLSPADLEKFKGLLVQKQSAVMDVMAAARAEGLTGSDNRAQVKQLVQDAQAEVESNIRTTLGDAAYAQYQSYEATVPQRNVVTQLEQRLSYSNEPLTDAQSQQMVQILAQTTPTKANGGQNGGGLGVMIGGPNAMFGGSPITTDAITQAQGILSAQQVAALQSLQQEQQANAQLRRQMRASFQNPPQPAALSGTTATTTTPVK